MGVGCKLGSRFAILGGPFILSEPLLDGYLRMHCGGGPPSSDTRIVGTKIYPNSHGNNNRGAENNGGFNLIIHCDFFGRRALRCFGFAPFPLGMAVRADLVSPDSAYQQPRKFCANMNAEPERRCTYLL